MNDAIAAMFGLSVGIGIIYLVRKNRLSARHGVSWIAAAGGLILLGLFPGLIDWAADLFGIAYPPTLAFLFALGVLTIKCLNTDLELSKAEARIIRLTQELAILSSRSGAPQEVRLAVEESKLPDKAPEVHTPDPPD